MGETYDARKVLPGWDAPGFDDGGWGPVDRGAEVEAGRPVASRPAGARLRRAQAEVDHRAQARHVRVRHGPELRRESSGSRPTGEPGRKITLRFAERLNPDGTIYTTNLREARVTDTYICNGQGEETWEPRFTFHGFQYVEVTGLKSRPTEETITGIALSSDTPVVGSFACSDPMLNQLLQQHLLDAAGQLHRHPDRLPPARRAAGLDRRCPGLHRHGGLDLRRPGVLHQVAGGPDRRPARRRPVPDGRAGEGGRRRRRPGLGRCRRHLPLDDLPGLRRPPAAGAAVSLDGQVRRVLPQAEHARAAAAQAIPLLRRLAEHQRRHAQGRHLHRLLRTQHTC